jgi:hypothetical protein
MPREPDQSATPRCPETALRKLPAIQQVRVFNRGRPQKDGIEKSIFVGQVEFSLGYLALLVLSYAVASTCGITRLHLHSHSHRQTTKAIGGPTGDFGIWLPSLAAFGTVAAENAARSNQYNSFFG